jgi:hypothetical protein
MLAPGGTHVRCSSCARQSRRFVAVRHAGGRREAQDRMFTPSGTDCSPLSGSRALNRRFLCEPRLSRPSWCALLRAAGVGQGGAPAAKRGRTNLDGPEGRCRLAMGRLTAAWGRPAFPRCSTNVVSSATTIVIGCPPWTGSAVASVLEGRPAQWLAGTPVAGADRGGDP